MTIETQQGKKSWIGDGSTTSYPYSCPFLNASDIEVYLDGEKQASGFSVQNKTDYSTGANIIFDVAPAEGVLIVIRRNVPMTQEISYPENGEFPAKSHEKSLDKLTMLIIDNNKETLKVGPATPEDFDVTFPVPEANKALKITADGKGFTMSDYDPDTALALTEDFKNQAQQAAIDALSSQTAAANSETIATQQANIATEKTIEVVQVKEEAVTTLKDIETNSLAKINSEFNKVNEWFERLNAIPYIPVGTILPTTGAIDESLGYQRYANGQLIANVSSQAPDLVKFLEFQEVHAPNLLCSETEWQTALTLSTLGQVGKYVWNKEEDSVRIPRIVNIQGMIDMNTVGNMVEAGLPNITGKTTFLKHGTSQEQNGAIKTSLASANKSATSSGSVWSESNFEFNASKSNSIYGKSSTVQEESILYPYVLQIATGVQYKTPVINTIELNNPFSLLDYKYSEYELNNLSWLRSEGQYNSKAVYPAVYDLLLKIYNGTETKAGVSVKLTTETFTDYDFVLNTAEETFRLPIKVKLASGKAVVGNGISLGITNGTNDYALSDSINTGKNRLNVGVAGSAVGSTSNIVSFPSSNTSTLGISTDPTKSGIETSDSGLYLYFYVGETVQNANLVNIGRIQETYTTKSMVDGQWVAKALSLVGSKLTIGTYTYDLSSYLPNDGYDYEVMFELYVNSAQTTYFNVITQDGFVMRSNTTAEGAIVNLFGILPIDTNRQVTAEVSNTDVKGWSALYAQGYRRIGTNL